MKRIALNLWRVAKPIIMYPIDLMADLQLSRALQLAVFASGGLAAFCVTLLAADRFSPETDFAIAGLLYWAVMAFYFSGFGQVLIAKKSALPGSPLQKFYDVYGFFVVMALTGVGYGLAQLVAEELALDAVPTSSSSTIIFYFSPPPADPLPITPAN